MNFYLRKQHQRSYSNGISDYSNITYSPPLNTRYNTRYSPLPSYSNNDDNADEINLKDKIFSPGDEDDRLNYASVNLSNSRSGYFMDNDRISNTNEIGTYFPVSPVNITKKKTLILDLDETLVHSSFKPIYFRPDIHLRIKFDNDYHNVYVLKRPFVDEFLTQMSKIFDIIVFTASIPSYANPLLDQLDKNRVIKGRLFRGDCVAKNGLYVKDLRVIGKDLKDVLIIDNNPISYSVNKDNGVPIKTWHYDKRDEELRKMLILLTYLSRVDDVRRIIRRVVVGNDINYEIVKQMIREDNEEREEERKANEKLLNRSKSGKQSPFIKTNNYVPNTDKRSYSSTVTMSNSQMNIGSETDSRHNNLNKTIFNSNTTRFNGMNSSKQPHSQSQVKINSYNQATTPLPTKINNYTSSVQRRENVMSMKDNRIENRHNQNQQYIRINRLKEEIINQINTTNPKVISRTIDYSQSDSRIIVSKPSTNVGANHQRNVNSHRPFNNNTINNPVNNSKDYNKIYANRDFENKSYNRVNSCVIPVKRSSDFQTISYDDDNNNTKDNSKVSSVIYGQNNNNYFSQNQIGNEGNYYMKRKMMCRQQSTTNINKRKCLFNSSAFGSTNVSFYTKNGTTSSARVHYFYPNERNIDRRTILIK